MMEFLQFLMPVLEYIDPATGDVLQVQQGFLGSLIGAGIGGLSRLFGGSGASSGGPARPQLPGGGVQSRVDQIMQQLMQGPTQQQRDMVGQIGTDLFNQGATQIGEQANRLMSGVSSSAAARGVTGSSIGLGGATSVGRRGVDQLARLRAGINTQSAQQLLQLPFQQANIGMQGANIIGGQQNAQMQAQAQQAAAQQQAQGQSQGAFFGSLGSILGSIL